MINIDELHIVNYCHPNCKPFFNICRLPKEEAFSLAYKMAADNLDTTAFYRFADNEIVEKYHYIEVQLWNDDYCT